ncbi:hypothetical protein BP6252_13949 [Coleophoma cylindrospora]|uniref:Uncharacterized protein n=1 Tax=Coleophoma cylindrospora TaxID=1849047 RepID=A0A3D8Q5A2_9HELO|nr:hypothetical protein BP6252_13949 [Coleophoma cylindrospora]
MRRSGVQIVSHEGDSAFDVYRGWELVVGYPAFTVLDLRQEALLGDTRDTLSIEIREHGFRADRLDPGRFVSKGDKLGVKRGWYALDGNHVHQTALFHKLHYRIAIQTIQTAEDEAYFCINSAGDFKKLSAGKHATLSGRIFWCTQYHIPVVAES